MLRFPRSIQATSAIDVTPVQRRLRAGRHRVIASVDGRPVWFDSPDTPLAAAAEAYGSALLVPAMHAGRPLRLADPVNEAWGVNLAALTNEWRHLWYPAAPRPLVVPRNGSEHSSLGKPSATASATALCFSGGVDAFHTLLHGGRPVHRLAYVVGYDVALRERRRVTDVTALVRDVAHHAGCQSTIIHTNLRRHPLTKRTPWLRGFGGAVAAIGHLLRGSIDRLLLSSDGLGFEHPEVGSRPSTDPLHGADGLAVEHVAATVTRLEKIRRIAGEPLVQRHLRVCWKNVGSQLNCGRCEKCIRTMLALDACGMLGRFASFDYGHGLIAAIDAMPAVDDVVDRFYRDLLDRGLSASLTAAVGRLLARTPPPKVRASVKAVRTPATRHRLLSPAAFSAVCEPLVGKRVGYVRPEGNVGDRLIELAMIQLFAEYGIRWRIWQTDVPGDTDGLDLLVFGGGGNMGTRYPGNVALRSRALESGLPVTILPQSFTSAEDRPYERVFVRERGSLALCPEGVLAPDLALGIASADPPRPTFTLGVFLRRDQERTGRKPLWARDPIRLRRDPLQYLALAARYRSIVTDRLHFAVAGLHAGREVTLVANDYHKNRSMHETWLAALGCRFAATSTEAQARRAA